MEVYLYTAGYFIFSFILGLLTASYFEDSDFGMHTMLLWPVFILIGMVYYPFIVFTSAFEKAAKIKEKRKANKSSNPRGY